MRDQRRLAHQRPCRTAMTPDRSTAKAVSTLSHHQGHHQPRPWIDNRHLRLRVAPRSPDTTPEPHSESRGWRRAKPRQLPDREPRLGMFDAWRQHT
jgi:hypothetical protein